MAKFVKQRRGIIDTDQRRFTASAGNEIVVVRRQYDVAFARQPILAAVGRHPCARAFSSAGEVVEIEQPNDFAVTLHLKRAHFGFEHRHCAGIFGKAHPI